MILEMKVPSPGESITDVEIADWLVHDGDYVEKDQTIAEVDSDKATLELPAEASGTITLQAEVGDAVAVGAVVCLIDTAAERPAGAAAPAPVEKKEVFSAPKEEVKNYAAGSPSPAAKKILDENDVDPSIKRYCVVSPEQVEDLLNTTEVKSSDFNTVKALAQGDINSFLGFTFLTSNRLTQDATPNRQVIAFASDGIKLGIGKDITAKISERDDKSYSTQVYYSMDLGATRMEEEKVVEIACQE